MTGFGGREVDIIVVYADLGEKESGAKAQKKRQDHPARLDRPLVD